MYLVTCFVYHASDVASTIAFVQNLCEFVFESYVAFKLGRTSLDMDLDPNMKTNKNMSSRCSDFKI